MVRNSLSKSALVGAPNAIEILASLIWKAIAVDAQTLQDTEAIVARSLAAARTLNLVSHDHDALKILQRRGLPKYICVLLCSLLRRTLAARQAAAQAEKAAMLRRATPHGPAALRAAKAAESRPLSAPAVSSHNASFASQRQSTPGLGDTRQRLESQQSDEDEEDDEEEEEEEDEFVTPSTDRHHPATYHPATHHSAGGNGRQPPQPDSSGAPHHGAPLLLDGGDGEGHDDAFVSANASMTELLDISGVDHLPDDSFLDLGSISEEDHALLSPERRERSAHSAASADAAVPHADTADLDDANSSTRSSGGARSSRRSAAGEEGARPRRSGGGGGRRHHPFNVSPLPEEGLSLSNENIEGMVVSPHNSSTPRRDRSSERTVHGAAAGGSGSDGHGEEDGVQRRRPSSCSSPGGVMPSPRRRATTPMLLPDRPTSRGERRSIAGSHGPHLHREVATHGSPLYSPNGSFSMRRSSSFSNELVSARHLDQLDRFNLRQGRWRRRRGNVGQRTMGDGPLLALGADVYSTFL